MQTLRYGPWAAPYWFGTWHRKGAVRRASERSGDPRLEHRVSVGRGLRDRLDHIPVLEDLAVFQSEDVHYRFSARVIGQAVPMTVQDNVVAVGKDALDLAASIREPGSDLPQAFHAVFDQRIVLAIGGRWASVKPEGIFDPTFDPRLVEGDSDVFVGLGHWLSPSTRRWGRRRVPGAAG